MFFSDSIGYITFLFILCVIMVKQKRGEIMEEKIEAIKEVIHKLRPYLQIDGGDLEFVDFKDGIVYVHMLGACAGCMMLDSTIKDGVEQILVEEVPGVIEVQAI